MAGKLTVPEAKEYLNRMKLEVADSKNAHSVQDPDGSPAPLPGETTVGRRVMKKAGLPKKKQR